MDYFAFLLCSLAQALVCFGGHYNPLISRFGIDAPISPSHTGHFALCLFYGKEQNMPKIDLASIPGLETAQALFGAVSDKVATYDDRIVALMVYVYDTAPPPPPPPAGLF